MNQQMQAEEDYILHLNRWNKEAKPDPRQFIKGIPYKIVNLPAPRIKVFA